MEPLRTRLRQALTAAMKRRDAAAVGALRTALGAIDNAEAVDPSGAPPVQAGVIAGGVAGLGAGDVARRELDEDDIAGIVRAEVAERLAAAAEYDDAGQGERADRLRAEAAALTAVLDGR
jgi:uncharacterized protein